MKTCLDCQKSFEISEEDFSRYEKLQVPEPARCVECRRKLRLAHWPYGIWQKRKCDATGESIISTYSSEARFPVYKREYWFSDKWDASVAEIDWGKSFFDQLFELQSKTPHFHQQGKQNENCDYADDVWECRNCYMSRSMAGCEDLSYCYRVLYCKSSLDLTYCYYTEQSYECTYCFKCYDVRFSFDCKECRDSWFLYDCRGCSNCFMCWNLRNKQYCIKNKQYSREEYERIVGELALGSRARIGELDAEFWGHLRKDAWHRASININTENCSGNYLTDSKGCGECYFLEDCEDDAYAMRCPQTKDCMDCSGLFRGEKCYEVSQSTDLNNVKFSIFATDCSDCFYVDQCVGCRHCFGCVGLKRREYCILNKQFSREEYEEIVEKLTEKMREEGEFGEMLPYRFAYNGFNLSLAAFYCDVPEGAWLESEPESEVAGVDGRDLADAEFGDDALNLVVNCAETGRPYKFVKHELDFYRRLGLSLPALYPEQRNKRRFGELMGLEGRMVKCAGCSGEVVTYWQEDKGFERIFCEACYLKEVY